MERVTGCDIPIVTGEDIEIVDSFGSGVLATTVKALVLLLAESLLTVTTIV